MAVVINRAAKFTSSPNAPKTLAEMPGVSKDRLNIHADRNTLVIEGDVAFDMPKDMEAMHVEVSLPRYRRTFTLSKELDTERMSAELSHGVLKLHIHKAEHAKPRRIEVQVG